MTYAEALDYIASLAPRGWRLGLDRMQAFAKRAHLEDALGTTDKPKFIHIAGTNGKGSTTAFVHSLLIEHGHSAGAFYSPYVYNPRERVQMGRAMISPDELACLTEELIPAAESLQDTELAGVTEFEFKTAIGFLHWKRRAADWVSLEVGLGGRLDSTNIVTPSACVIVSIGLDHTAILGDSIEAIAFEKAGIIKTGIPVVVGDVPPAAREVILAEAERKGGPVWEYGMEVRLTEEAGTWTVETPERTHRGLAPGIVGVKQPHNMSLAIAAIDAAGAFRREDGSAKGVAAATAPGRYQRFERNGQSYLLDGAHNFEAIEVLAETLCATHQTKPTVIFGMVKGHEPEPILRTLGKFAERIVVSPIDFRRAYDPRELKEVADALCLNVEVAESSEDAVRRAEAEHPGLILVTGSFYLVGEVGRHIGADQPFEG